MIPDECSLECVFCGTFNVKEGLILHGEIICWNCINKPDINKYKFLKKKVKK